MPKKRRKKNWSYNAGERGRNWVRAFQQSRDGRYYIEWREDGRRRAVLLKGVTTPDGAKQKADELASGFAGLETQPAPVTLTTLFKSYLKEVTPTKGASKQGHDRRAYRVWTSFFGAQEPARWAGRRPENLDRIDWDRFISARRDGYVPGWLRSVKDRQVRYDLQFLIAVLNWAVGAKLIASNPWGTEIRRVQRWGMPRELNPHRPPMPDDIRDGLVAHAPGWQFRVMLVIERETRRRNNAIRQLWWSDVDFTAETVRWRHGTDKSGRQNTTPLTAAALEVLRSIPRGIGDTPIFLGRNGCTSRHTCQTWLRRAKAKWLRSVPEAERAALLARLEGVGFHSEKRSGVRDAEFRALPPAIQEELSGTSYNTLRNTYDEVTVEDMREAIRAKKPGRKHY